MWRCVQSMSYHLHVPSKRVAAVATKHFIPRLLLCPTTVLQRASSSNCCITGSWPCHLRRDPDSANVPAQVIQPTRAFAKHKIHRHASNRKTPQQIIPARQRVLSKLGLLHNSSLKHLVRIRPAGAVPCTPIRPAQSPELRSPRQEAMPPGAMTQAAARLAAQRGNAKQTQLSPMQQQHVPRLRSVGGVYNKHAVAHSSPDNSAAANIQQPGQSGLVEDEIDWSSSIPVASAVASDTMQPNSEHCWTTQFLEQESMQASARHLPPGMTPETAFQDCRSRNQSIFPVKHETSAWVEDDIQWE